MIRSTCFITIKNKINKCIRVVSSTSITNRLRVAVRAGSYQEFKRNSQALNFGLVKRVTRCCT